MAKKNTIVENKTTENSTVDTVETKGTETVKTEAVEKVKDAYTFKFNSTGKMVKTVRKELAELLRKDSRYTEVE